MALPDLIRDRSGHPSFSVITGPDPPIQNAYPLLLFGHRSAPGFYLCFGLGQEAKAALAPREINADIQQRIGPPAWAGKIQDGEHTVGLSGDQRHWPPRNMVRGGIDAKHKIARSDCVAHDFHPLLPYKTRPPRSNRHALPDLIRDWQGHLSFLSHCEAQRVVAIRSFSIRPTGLLRSARNDEKNAFQRRRW